MQQTTVGMFLKQRRLELGYTTKQVACKIGITEKQYKLYENDKINFRRVSTLHIAKLCMILEMSLSTFYQVKNSV